MNIVIKESVKRLWRLPYQKKLRHKLENHNFSIISANCIGGILSHDLGEQFRSPTVNLIIPEYLKFVSNLNYYLDIPIRSVGKDKHGWPVGKIGDIDILGVHYKNEEDLISAWERRRKRVNFDNIFLIATDEYINKPQDIEAFSKLNYPKVLFKSDKNITYDFEVFIPGTEGNDDVGDLLRYANILGVRKFEKFFDCVGWLNSNMYTETA